MKMSEVVITESDFLWYGVGAFAQNRLKYAKKINSITFAIQITGQNWLYTA